jgi:hypothetical protein
LATAPPRLVTPGASAASCPARCRPLPAALPALSCPQPRVSTRARTARPCQSPQP